MTDTYNAETEDEELRRRQRATGGAISADARAALSELAQRRGAIQNVTPMGRLGPPTPRMPDWIPGSLEERARFDDEMNRWRFAQSQALSARLNLSIPADKSPESAARMRRNMELYGTSAMSTDLGEINQNVSTVMRSPTLTDFFADDANAALARDDVRPLSFWQVVGDLFGIGNPTGGLSNAERFGDSRIIQNAGRHIARGVRQSYIAGLAERENVESALDDDASQQDGAPISRRLGNLVYRNSAIGDDYRPLTDQERYELDAWRHDEIMGLMPHADMGDNFGGWFLENIVPTAQGLAEVPRGAFRGGRIAWERAVRSWEMGDNTPAGALERVSSVLNFVPDAVVSGGTGAILGPIAYTYQQEAGNAYLEYTQQVGPDGEFMDRRIAGAYARDVGAINSAFEILNLTVIGEFLGAGKLAGFLASSGVRSAFRRYAMTEGLRRMAVGIGGTALSEGSTEMLQETSVVALGEMARLSDSGALDMMSPQEVAGRLFDVVIANSSRILEAGVGGAVIGGGIATVVAPITIGSLIEDARAGEAQQEIWRSIEQQAESSKLRERAPGVYQRLIEKITRGTPIEQVAINVEDFVGAFNQDVDKARAAARELNGVGAETFDEALKSGGDIFIPAATMATQVAGTAEYTHIAEHAKMGPDVASIAEVKARLELGVDVQRAIEAGAKLQEQATALEEAKSRVRQEFFDRMKSSEAWGQDEINGALAELFADGYFTIAKAAGIDPAQMPSIPSVVGPFGQRKLTQSEIDAGGFVTQGEENIAASVRGATSFDRSVDSFITAAKVIFTESRNVSTAVHEIFGHYFLELLRFAAAQENATPILKQDWQATLEWLDMTDARWEAALRIPDKAAAARALAPAHEKFARAIEVYFLEGRAPTARLKRVFRMLKLWVLRAFRDTRRVGPGDEIVHPLYKGLLDGKIRPVLDRMFATQEAVQEYAAMMGSDEITTREEWGSVGNKHADAAYERYRTRIVDARRRAEEAIDAAAISALAKESTQERRRAERRARRTVDAEMAQDPAWIAHDAITGRFDLPQAEGVRLNSALVFEEYGPEAHGSLPRGSFDKDTEGLVTIALEARGVREPLRFAKRVQQLGIHDPSGQIEAIQGNKKGLRKADEGRSVSEAIGVLWDEGWFGERNASENFMQSASLVAVHNTRADRLLKAHAMGGFAVPSLAIVRADIGFDNFGEISLIAPPSFIDPRINKSARVFNADIYSPRYPSVQHQVNDRLFSKLIERPAFQEASKDLGYKMSLELDESTLTEKGLRAVAESTVVQLAYARMNGVEIELPIEKDYNGNDRVDYWNLRRDLASRYGQDADFIAWVDEEFSSAFVGERIYLGYSDTGRRRFLPHTLDNVVRIMKRNLRDGEGFNYGVGNIRATVARQFRSMSAIKGARNQIVSEDAIKSIKDEANDEFWALANELRQKTHFTDRDFGWGDTFSEHLKEVAQTGRMSSIFEYYKEPLSNEEQEAIAQYLEKLRDLPTEYFEAKITRAVALSEFVAAVVPSDVDARVIAALNEAGITDIKMYDRGDIEARRVALGGMHGDIYFQNRESKTQTIQPRAVYDLPQTTVYRNPSERDIFKLLGNRSGNNEYSSARAIIDQNGNVFVFKGLDAIHDDVARSIRKNTDNELPGYIYETDRIDGELPTKEMLAPTRGGFFREGEQLFYAQHPDATPVPAREVLRPTRAQPNASSALETYFQGVWHSGLDLVIEGSPVARADAKQWIGIIRNAGGVADDELEFSGVIEWLEAQEGQITRDDLLTFLRFSGVQIEETVLGASHSGSITDAELVSLLNAIEERDRLQEEYDDIYNSGTFHPESRTTDFSEEQQNELSGLETRMSSLDEKIAALEKKRGNKSGGDETRWDGWVLPNGQNYRELLLTLPSRLSRYNAAVDYIRKKYNIPSHEGWAKYVTSAERLMLDMLTTEDEQTYSHPHWRGYKNVFAHVRFNERISADGKRILFIEELQSDWHQTGRKWGYKGGSDIQAIEAKLRAAGISYDPRNPLTWSTDDAVKIKQVLSATEVERLRAETGTQLVPNGPFKNNAWASFGLKRIIRWAAENNFDEVGWIEGQVAVDRFSLEETVGEIRAYTDNDGSSFTVVLGNYKASELLVENGLASENSRGNSLSGGGFITMTPDQMREAFGETIAEKIIAQGAPTSRSGGPEVVLNGDDLKVGGDGMRAFYDKILPNIANDLGKKFGVRAGPSSIPVPSNAAQVSAYKPSDYKLEQRDAGWVIVRDRSLIPGYKYYETIDEAKAELEKILDGFKPVPQASHSLPITPEMRAAAISVGVSMFGKQLINQRAIKAETYNQDVEAEFIERRADMVDRLIADIALSEQQAIDVYRGLLADHNEKTVRAMRLRLGISPTPVGTRKDRALAAQAEAAASQQEIANVLDAISQRYGESAVAAAGVPVSLDMEEQIITTSDLEAALRERNGEMAHLKRMLKAAGKASDPEMSPDRLNAIMADVSEEIETMKAEIERRTKQRAIGAWQPVGGMAAVARATDEEVLDWFHNSGDVRVTRQPSGDPVIYFKTDPLLRGFNARLTFDEREIGKFVGTTHYQGRFNNRERDGSKRKPTARQRQMAMAFFVRMAMVTRAFVLINKPETIEFTGGSESHEKLYTSMLRIFDFAGYTARVVREVTGRTNIGPVAHPRDRSYASEALTFLLLRPDIAMASPPRDIPPTGVSESAHMSHTVQFNEPGEGGRRNPGLLIWFSEVTTDVRNATGAEATRDPKASHLFSRGNARAVRFVPIDIGRDVILTTDALAAKERAVRALDEGEGWFYQEEEPPTEGEFLDALRDDISGTQPRYRAQDVNASLDWAEAQRVRAFFARRGIDINSKPEELRKQIELAASQLDDRGVDADTMAAILNAHIGHTAFRSGQELIETVAALPKRSDYIKQRIDQIVRGELGDPMDDLPSAASLSMHNIDEEQKLLMELQAIQDATGRGAGRAINRTAREYAERRIAMMSVKQVENPDWFLNTERRWAKAAQEALRKQDHETAQKAKFNQLVNFHLYKLARAAQTEMERTQVYFRRLQKLGARASISADYYEQIEALLDQYELRKISGTEINRRISLTEWVKRMEDRGLGHMVQIDPAIIARAERRPFSQLTVDEARSLRDAIKNIEHLGRLKDRLLTAAEQRTFEGVLTDLIERMEETGPVSKEASRNYSEDQSEQFAGRLRRWNAALTRMEFLFRYIDGQHNGVMWRTLFMPFAKAADQESAYQYRVAAQLTALWDKYSPSERASMFKTRISIPELAVDSDVTGLNDTFTRMELIAIALNTGNSGNVAALVDGFGWFAAPEGIETDYNLARSKIIAALDKHLSKRDWDFVQETWGIIGQFRDEAFSLHERLTGLRPEAVEPLPVNSKHGTYAGGYYPLKFDPLRDAVVERREAKENTPVNNWGVSSLAPMTKKGHLIDRKGSGGRPVRLDFAVATNHIQNVVHDISYREALIDANRIISDARFRAAFIRTVGKEQYAQLHPWLHSIAVEYRDPASDVGRFLQKMRGNMQVVTMGVKIATATQQIAGILQAVPMLGGPEMAAGVARLLGNPFLLREKSEYIMSKSEFMRTRVRSFNRDVREFLRRVKDDGVYHKVQRNAFSLVGAMDWAVSSVVWITAYEKARAGKVTGIEGGVEVDAVRFADSVVRQTQSAGLNQDLPLVMRNTEMEKLVTAFYSYFSVLYNWSAYDQVLGVRKGRLPLYMAAGNFFLIYILSPLLTEWLAGRWDKEGEDDEERLQRLLAVVAKSPFSSVPILRDVANTFNSFYEYSLTPFEGGVQSVVDLGEDIASGDILSNERAQKNGAFAIGFVFGLPTAQAYITADYLRDYAEGEEEGLDLTEALLRDTR